MQGRTAASPSLPRRGGALALTAGIHLLALFLFLRPAEPKNEAAPVRTLSIFDLPLPPVPPVPSDDPPPLVVSETRTAPSGGSPGIARERPSERAILPDEAPVTVDVTPVPEAPPMPRAATGGAAAAGDAGAGSSGAGIGSGSGSGAGTGAGGTIGTPTVTLGYAEWITKPSDEDVQREWPFRSRNVDARVVLSCRVRRGNRPYGCSVLYEVPAGLGFGQAAIRLTYRSRIRPMQVNGRDWYDLPVGIPFRFAKGVRPLKPLVSEEAPAPSP